jgi:hypothetical protein
MDPRPDRPENPDPLPDWLTTTILVVAFVVLAGLVALSIAEPAALR